MIKVRLTGGLGNQLFQYAAARTLARLHRSEMLLDLSFYRHGRTVRSFELGQLNIAAAKRVYRNGLRMSDYYFSDRETGFDPRFFSLPDAVYLDGYFESGKYFASIEDVIRREYTPADPDVLDAVRAFLGPLRDRSAPLVAVHVRRGDFFRAFPHLVLGADQIRHAFDWFGGCSFVVFSDDIPWCEEHLPADGTTFSKGHSSLFDLIAMSRCDHQVLSHGTFSWWGAWLNDSASRQVLAPVKAYSAASVANEANAPPGWRASELARA